MKMPKIKKFLKRYKLKIIFIIATVFVITVIFALFSVDSTTNKSNIDYISSYGWKTDSSPAEIAHVRLPEEQSSIYKAYGQIASADGKNLESYSGKNVTRYSYNVTNHKYSDKNNVRANIYVYKSEIIAADISVLMPDGSTAAIDDTSEMQ